jgi:NAD-dependent SIR2 family protein deacetylase
MTTNIWMDGNEHVATLRQLFAADISVARGQCATCGQEGALTDALMFEQAPGFVSRCPHCESVLFRVVRGPDRAWLDMRGVVCLEFAMPD